jgi:tRNA(Ile)-lysidine synthase
MNCKFEHSVLATVKTHALITPHDRILVSVSGGPDSMALLHFLHRVRALYDLSLFCIHINHGIRGTEGARDADSTAYRSLGYGIPVRVLNFDVPYYAKREGLSLEEAGRVVRYSLLLKHARGLGATRIATGHTRDDQVETLLMRILRGTGLTGLRAIQAHREGRFIRPFITMTKTSIIHYLVEAGLSWCSDSTNFSGDHLRNRIRHKLLPLLKDEYNPSVEESLYDLGVLATGDEEVLCQLTEALFKSLALSIRGGIALECRRLALLPRGLQRRIIRRAFAHIKGDIAGISFKNIEQTLDALEHPVGCTIHLPGSMVARREYSWLRIEAPDGQELAGGLGEHLIRVPGKTDIGEINITIITSLNNSLHENFSSSRRRIYLDRERVSLPLRIRKRREGDRFVPFGMTGEKKLKEFFINEKIPRQRRDRIPVLVDSEDRIVWIVGHRMDDRVRVTNTSREILSISFTSFGQDQEHEPFLE